MKILESLREVLGSLPPPVVDLLRYVHRWMTVRLPLALATRRIGVPRSLDDGLRTAWVVRSRLVPRWERIDADRASPPLKRPPTLRVMVGTLHSGEPQFERLCESVRAQSYPEGLVDHVVISGHPNRDAHDALYTRFLEGPWDLLVKVDADMVIEDPDFLSHVASFFEHARGVDLLQAAITDFYTSGPMHGVNAYTKHIPWRSSEQDDLFTDRTGVPLERHYVVPTRFLSAVTHSPSPSDLQAFRFGVRRALEVRTALDRSEEQAATEQAVYLEKTYRHYTASRTRALLLASVACERTYRGDFRVADLDTGESRLPEEAAALSVLREEDLQVELERVRSEPQPQAVAAIREAAQQHLQSREINSVLFLLPHAQLYGGVLRFFALAREFAAVGMDVAIAVPDNQLRKDRLTVARDSQYGRVPVVRLSSVHNRVWDAAVCGDHSSGLMALLPWLPARRTAVYLLNGWAARSRNVRQVAIASPDVVLANSSYSAEQYPELLPHVVAGGVDLGLFTPGATRPPTGRDAVTRIGAPAGRLRAGKRLVDATEAVARVRASGLQAELHLWNATPLSLELPEYCHVHVGLNREGVAGLLQTLDTVVCPEEDAGWNNPAAEAMACGVPLVCTEAGTTDFASHRETAMVVEARRPDLLAAAILDLASDPDLAMKLRDGGLARIARFAWASTAAQLVDVLSLLEPLAPTRSVNRQRAERQLLQEIHR